MSDLLNDARTVQILDLLWKTPNREGGIPIIELPKELQDDGLFTEWIAGDLIEVVRPKHHHIGGGIHRTLVLDAGWDKYEPEAPKRKRIWQMLQEAVSETVATEIRHRVRLGKTGEKHAARITRISKGGREYGIFPVRRAEDASTDLTLMALLLPARDFQCPNCGGPLPSFEVTWDMQGTPELRWCRLCREPMLVLDSPSKSISGFKKAMAKLAEACESRRRSYPVIPDPATSDGHQFAIEESAEFIRYQKLPIHWFGKITDKGDSAETLAQLWYFIVHVAIVVLETTRGYSGPNSGSQRSLDPLLVEVFSALHRLGAPETEDPPYPHLTRQETIDKLRSIANRLERLEASNISASTSVNTSVAYVPNTPSTGIGGLKSPFQLPPGAGLTKRESEFSAREPTSASAKVNWEGSIPIVFISYSHDSDAHRELVLRLSERLRRDGVETILDRYTANGSPPEGWPRWMMNGLNAATNVLCVCTEIYRRRFLGLEVPDAGKGADWEGALITQALHDARSNTNKFIPVLFRRSDESHIPDPLRAQTHYVLESEANYHLLYDAMLGQAGVEPGAVGNLKLKPRATGCPLDFDGIRTEPPPSSS